MHVSAKTVVNLTYGFLSDCNITLQPNLEQPETPYVLADALQIPIIAMTANAFAEDVQACVESGMNGHLSKPIVMDEVVKAIWRNIIRK